MTTSFFTPKIKKKLLLLLCCVLGFVSLQADVQAQNRSITTDDVITNCDNPGGSIFSRFFQTDLACQDDPNAPDGQILRGEFQLRALVELIVNALKRFVIPVAIIFLAITGLRLYFKSTDESSSEYTKNVMYGNLWAFGIFALGILLVDSVFFGTTGEILTGQGDDFQIVNDFGGRLIQQIQGIFAWGSSFVGGLAVLFIIIAALQMMTGGEDAIQKAKTRIIMSLGGVVAVLAAKQIFGILTNGKGQVVQPNLDLTIQLMGGWFNFLMGVITVLSFVSIIAGGIRFMLSFGRDEERQAAQRMILYSAIALVLSFSVWTIISYFATAFSPSI